MENFQNYFTLFSFSRKTKENLLAVVHSNTHGSTQQHYLPLHQDYSRTPTEALFTTQTELPNTTYLLTTPTKLPVPNRNTHTKTELPTTQTGLTYPPPQQSCPTPNTTIFYPNSTTMPKQDYPATK